MGGPDAVDRQVTIPKFTLRKTAFYHINITITWPFSSSALSKALASSKVTKPKPLDLIVSRSVITRAANNRARNLGLK